MTKAVVEKAVDQGVHRFLADGVHYRDLMDIRAEAADWTAWPETWSRHGDAAAQRAENALSQGSTATAASEFARAALYHHYGQYLLYADLVLKKRIHDKKVMAFARAASLFEDPFERIEIPFDGVRMGAYFRAPRGIERPPCVILMGGLDTTKEDYLTINDLCIRRGLATLAAGAALLATARIHVRRPFRWCPAAHSTMTSSWSRDTLSSGGSPGPNNRPASATSPAISLW